MSYIPCRGKMAARPFTIKNSGLNIYSIEELCYYIYNNVFDLPEDFVSVKLCNFLSEELELVTLAVRLRSMLGNPESREYERLIAIVSESDYLTAQELLDFKTSIQRLSGCRTLQRYKLKADSLFKKGRIDRAISQYKSIIEHREFTSQEEIFRSYVYYNLGVAFSFIYHYDEAFDSFYKAYKLKRDDRNSFTAMIALYLDIENKDDFMKQAVEKGFSITNVAQAEDIIKDCISHSDRLPVRTVEDIVRSARIAMS